VRSVHVGRESIFELNPEPIEELRKYLDRVSELWDWKLARLRSFVEAEET
jgi:hypothetical protein